MEYHKHYTRAEARTLLPLVRRWLGELVNLRKDLKKYDHRLAGMMAPGRDLGGELVNSWVRVMADMKSVMLEFDRREIQVKDLDRGLVDFPAIIDGREVFLCWEDGEDDIEFWHDLETGYAGRERLEDDEL